MLSGECIKPRFLVVSYTVRVCLERFIERDADLATFAELVLRTAKALIAVNRICLMKEVRGLDIYFQSEGWQHQKVKHGDTAIELLFYLSYFPFDFLCCSTISKRLAILRIPAGL